MVLLLNQYRILIFSVAIAVFVSLISGVLEVGVAVILLSYFSLLIPRNLYIAAALLALLTVVSNFGDAVRAIVQITSIGILLLAFIKEYGYKPENFKKLPPYIVYYIVFLLFSMIVAGIFSRYPGASVTFILRTIAFFTVAYIIYSIIRQERDIWTFMIVLTISSLIFSISVIADFMSSGAELMNLMTKAYTRSSGFMSNINAIGGIIANLVPITFAFLFYSKFDNKTKLVVIIILITLFAGILFTSSRASFVSIFFSIIIILFILRKRFLKWVLIIIPLSVLALLFYEPSKDILFILFRVEGGLAGREVFWDLALNIIKDNPWLGIGPGAYKYEVFNYLPVLLGSWRGNTIKDLMEVVEGRNSSHNMYLLFFSDMGIMGFLASLLVIVIFFKISIPLLNFYRNLDELKYTATVGIFAMGAGAFIRCLFMEMGVINYGYLTTDLPFWIFFAIIIHLFQKDIKKVQ